MGGNSYEYFDEAYFQEGSKRGTAYVNYKEGARNSPIFREIANSIKEVFRPQRVLDVGCATGSIVFHLNALGCEAHGIDVSEWAVRNAEHPNVKLASADALPYPDGFFDLVLTCHSMEHLPDSVFEKSIREITRVGSAYFFHMLPMIGTPPYTGDPIQVRQNLRKDPTHQQLHPKEWWVRQFETNGCVQLNTCILLKNDTSTAELSGGQFLLKKTSSIDESDVLCRATSRNQRIFRELQLARPSHHELPPSSAGQFVYADRVWKETDRKLSEGETIDLAGRTINLITIIEGKSCVFRFAAGRDSSQQEYSDVGEFYISAGPGCTAFTFSTDQLSTLRGNPDYSAVNHMGFGGENEGAKVSFFVCDQLGHPLLT